MLAGGKEKYKFEFVLGGSRYTPPVEFLISKMRNKFLESKMRSPDLDEPFHYVFELCKRHHTRGYKFLNKCRTLSLNTDSLGKIRDIITNKPDNATKYVTYRTAMNPDLSVHEVYKCEDIYIPDYLRIAFTRVRVMSHNLKVETGRWSRTPTEQRICCCNENKVQDERHVLLECPISTEYRQNFQMLDYSSVHNLFKDETHCKNLCNYIYKVLNTY